MNRFRKEIDYYLYNFAKLKTSTKKEDIKWVKIISEIREKYEGTEYGRLIELKWDQKLSEEKIKMLMHIEKTTLYAWMNKIINEITLKAAYQRLIKPY
jgi:hypothetical protein